MAGERSWVSECLVWSGRFSSDDGVSTINTMSQTPAGVTKITNPPTKNNKKTAPSHHHITPPTHPFKPKNQKQANGGLTRGDKGRKGGDTNQTTTDTHDS